MQNQSVKVSTYWHPQDVIDEGRTTMSATFKIKIMACRRTIGMMGGMPQFSGENLVY
jgi:hypothetical protein